MCGSDTYQVSRLYFLHVGKPQRAPSRPPAGRAGVCPAENRNGAWVDVHFGFVVAERQKMKANLLAEGVGMAPTFLNTLWTLADKRKILKEFTAWLILKIGCRNGAPLIYKMLSHEVLCVRFNLNPCGVE